jgi:UDP-N-acetylmuramate dehydrogenase
MAVPRLARAAGLAGLTGLEHTAGIPGTVGGLAAMNGGSLGRSIGERIRTVRCLDECGRVVELDGGACGFAYRRSVFLDKPWVITEAVLELEKGDTAAIAGAMRGILRERRSKYPRRMPNCGSVFKSHPAIYARYGPPGKVIEELGFKGTRIGDAEVSRLHANFIVNHGRARAADVRALIGLIGERVYDKTGVRMECEVRLIDY